MKTAHRDHITKAVAYHHTQGGRIMNSRITVFLCLFVIIFIASGVYAIWMADGSPVCVQPYDQLNPQSVPDGRGGAIRELHQNRCQPVRFDGIRHGVAVLHGFRTHGRLPRLF